MAKRLLLLLALAGCRTPPPTFVPVPKPPEMPLAPLPEPVTAVIAPQTVTPVVASAAKPVVAPLLAALAAEDTPAVAALLADDVSVTLANGDACVGAQACGQAIARALVGTKLQVLRRLQPSAEVAVVQGLVEIAQRRVPFALVLRLADGRVAQARVYGATAPWRFTLDAPKTPLPPATSEPVDVVTAPPRFDAGPLAAAFDPATLARDATAAGLVAEQLTYHDTTSQRETTTAQANQAAIRAFAQAFAVESSALIGQHAAGDWLVLEREVVLQQRAPVVPVPPSAEALHVRTLEFLLVQNRTITEVWGYCDPVAFAPAVEQPAIPALH